MKTDAVNHTSLVAFRSLLTYTKKNTKKKTQRNNTKPFVSRPLSVADIEKSLLSIESRLYLAVIVHCFRFT